MPEDEKTLFADNTAGTAVPVPPEKPEDYEVHIKVPRKRQRILDSSLNLYRALPDSYEPDIVKVHSAEEPQRRPRVPRRPKDLKRWQATWKAVYRQWISGKPYSEILKWLGNMHPHLACCPETLTKIIQAGEAGLLET